MTIRLHNTLGGRKEVFQPSDPKRVTLYVCGPTVYGPPHLGNARSAVVFDLLYRLLRYRYAQVRYARNITDIDDKIQAAAQREGVDISRITERYTLAYHDAMRALHVLPPSLEPRATKNLDEIQRLIAELLASGHAYQAEGHLLFSVASHPPYGEFSGRQREEMLAGARVKPAAYKQDPMDFVLWKPSTPEQPGWDSPWGRGRPGWHIECSAMVRRHLGPLPIDLHGGGRDLIFPHHENEIAQVVAGRPGQNFCRYWVHNGFVRVQREKMSKSQGNVLLVQDLLQESPGEVLRCALLSTHYRHPLEWSQESLSRARRTMERLYRAVRDSSAPAPPGVAPPDDFMACLEDDLNTPAAMACLHALARQVSGKRDLTERRHAADRLRAAGALLGLLQQSNDSWLAVSSAALEAPDEQVVEPLLAARRTARRAGDYARADQIRAELQNMGVQIHDHPDGNATWSPLHSEK